MNSISVIFAAHAPDFSTLQAHGTPISRNWSGEIRPRTARVLFWVDLTHFHFLASDENSSGLCHPMSLPSKYQAELWKYDVAEFFLKSVNQPNYLEFNLAPNGSWWSCAFSEIRKPSPGQPAAIPDIQTSAQQNENSWQASAKIPLPWLQTHYGFGKKSLLNATFIANSPAQEFLSLADLGGGDPDFHRPDRFPPVRPVSL